MAEAFGVVAGIVGLLEAGSRISTRLRTVRQTWKNAPTEVLLLQNEITDFNLLLRYTKDVCDSASDLSEDSLAQSLKRHLTSAKLCLTALSDLVDGASTQDGSKLKRWWVRHNKTVKSKRDHLRELHTCMRKLLDAFNGKHGPRIALELTSLHSEVIAVKSQTSEHHNSLQRLLEQAISGIERVSKQHASLETSITGAVRQQSEEMSQKVIIKTPQAAETASGESCQAPASFSIWASYRNGVCAPTCECSCHLLNTHHSLWQTPHFLRNFLGFFFASYVGLPAWVPHCDVRGCRRIETKTYWFKYEFPRWFLGMFVYILILKHQTNVLPRINFKLSKRSSAKPGTLIAAAFWGEADQMRQILLDDPTAIFEKTEIGGFSPVYVVASQHRTAECLSILIRNGASLEEEDDYGISGGSKIACHLLSKFYTRSHEAVIAQTIPVMSLVDALDLSVATKIILGLQMGDLRSALANIPPWDSMLDRWDRSGLTPLHWAVRAGHTDAVELLLQHGVNINTPSSSGETALFDLLKAYPTAETFRAFVERGADLQRLNNLNTSVFDFACSIASVELVTVMVEEYGINPNKPSAEHSRGTPLHQAVLNDWVDVVKYLISVTVDLDAADEYQMTPLFYALYLNAPKSMQLLLEKGASYVAYVQGMTILHLAACYGSEEVMLILAEHGLAGVDVQATGVIDEHTAEDWFLARPHKTEGLKQAFYDLLKAVEKSTDELQAKRASACVEADGYFEENPGHQSEDNSSDEEQQSFHDVREDI